MVASLAVGASFVVALMALPEMLALPEDHRAVETVLYSWIAAGDLAVPFSLLLDPLSIVMVLVVTGVGFLIHVYATGYMRGDPGYARFFAYMNLFVLAMLTLVLAGNFLLLVVGWGGVGFSSYALIAFWFHEARERRRRHQGVRRQLDRRRRPAAGDLPDLDNVRHGWTTRESSRRPSTPSPSMAPTSRRSCCCCCVGAAAKSAQFPLHIWLPDAMAGPTPVSALIHAATMVTAGVYLISRMHPLYLLAPTAMIVVAGIGAVTALFAATIGLVQPNIKRVLAYSTVSQLGYMFLAVGVGAVHRRDVPPDHPRLLQGDSCSWPPAA